MLPAVEQRSVPISAMLAEAHPAALEGETLTLEFPKEASFHRERAEEPKSVALLQDALYEVTGRRLEVAFTTGARAEPEKHDADRPVSEEEIVELMKTTFDAQELERWLSGERRAQRGLEPQHRSSRPRDRHRGPDPPEQWLDVHAARPVGARLRHVPS